MRIALAADHAGFRTKARLARLLPSRGHDIFDYGTSSEAPVDYPDFVHAASAAVAAGACDRGIVIGGSGNGEAMAANRRAQVRCAVCWSEESARLARAHNDANMLALGQRLLDDELIVRIVEVWLTTPFEGGRHTRRIALLDIRPTLTGGSDGRL